MSRPFLSRPRSPSVRPLKSADRDTRTAMKNQRKKASKPLLPESISKDMPSSPPSSSSPPRRRDPRR